MQRHETGPPNELAALLGPFWSEDRARRALGVESAEAMRSRRHDGTLLALDTTNGTRLYPVWQFHRAAGHVEVRPALVPLMRALRHHNSWTVATFLNTPAPELDGHTPMDALRNGYPATLLIDLAHTVAREWSAGTSDTDTTQPSAAHSN